jgi:hypothetical protein
MSYASLQDLSEKEAYKRFDLILQFGLINPDFGIFSVCLKEASA